MPHQRMQELCSVNLPVMVRQEEEEKHKVGWREGSLLPASPEAELVENP